MISNDYAMYVIACARTWSGRLLLGDQGRSQA
jgi:hypothetical protein